MSVLDEDTESAERSAYWCSKCGTPRYYCGCLEEYGPDSQPPHDDETDPIKEPWGPAR